LEWALPPAACPVLTLDQVVLNCLPTHHAYGTTSCAGLKPQATPNKKRIFPDNPNKLQNNTSHTRNQKITTPLYSKGFE